MSRQLSLLWGAVALALVALSPLGATLAAALPSCLFRDFAGIACPTCGTTRAALALARLDPLRALAFNPLATLGWALLIGGGAIAGSAALANRPLAAVRLPTGVAARVGVIGVVLANWAYLIWAGI
jgi:hypothetical protein